MSEAAGTAAAGALAGLASSNPYGLAIGAGVGLLQGLLSSQARKEEEARRRKFEAEQMGYNTQTKAAQALTAGEQSAFQQLMSGYQSSILGRR